MSKKKNKFKVGVEEYYYRTSWVEVEADDEDEAEAIVAGQIESGDLKSYMVLWGDFEPDSGTFRAGFAFDKEPIE